MASPRPPRAYRLLDPDPTGTGGRRLSPFVGRAPELDLLVHHLRQVRATGHGHVVSLKGEPGAGKSRLLLELRRLLAAERVPYLEGRCAAHGADTPYLPLLDLLRRAWRLDADDSFEETARRLHAAVDALGLESAALAPYLLALLGSRAALAALDPLSPETIRARLFDALQRILRAHADGGPLVLLIEDAHWIDRTSEAFLATVVDALPGLPILAVVTARPGYETPWLARSFASQLALPPLDDRQARTIARAILPAAVATDSLLDQILARAEGNPFFLEELTWAVTGLPTTGEPAAVPVTIAAALTARMDRLPPAPRHLLETAAVLGREAPLSLLEALTGTPSPHLAPLLRQLVAGEFLYEQPGPTFVFKHALTQEVAYAQIPGLDCQRLHAAAAHALEAIHVARLDEVLVPLARHWSCADDHSRAIEYLTRLAERASALHALTEVVSLLEEALARCDRLPPGDDQDARRIRILVQLVVPLTLLGRAPEARDRLLPFRDRVHRLEAGALTGPFSFVLALAHDHTGQHEHAEPMAKRALEMATAAGDDTLAGRSLVLLAHAALWGGASRVGLERSDRAIAALERTSEGWWLGIAHWIRGHHLVLLGDLEAARAAGITTRAVGERIANERFVSYGTCIEGWATARTGDIETGLKLCQRAVELAPDPLARFVVAGYLAEASTEVSAPADVRPLLEEAAAFLGGASFPQVEAWHVARLASVEWSMGHVEKALDVAYRARELARRARFVYAEALAERTIGRIARADSPAGARRHLHIAVEMLGRIDAGYDAVRTRLELAIVDEVLGRDEDARAERERCLAELAAMGVSRPYLAELARTFADGGAPERKRRPSPA